MTKCNLDNASMAKESELEAGFQRIRRNLTVASTIAIFGTWAGVDLPNEVPISGATVGIENPDVLLYAFWTVLVYWLWRYYQYFRDSYTNEIKGNFLAKMQQLSYSEAVRLAPQQPFVQTYLEDSDSEGIVNVKTVPVGTLGSNPLAVAVEGNITIQNKNNGSVSTQRLENIRIEIPSKKLPVFRIKSAIHVFLNTRAVTEFMFPFALAATALIAGACSLLIQ